MGCLETSGKEGEAGWGRGWDGKGRRETGKKRHGDAAFDVMSHKLHMCT